MFFSFFFNEPSTTNIYTYLHTLSLHDARPIYRLDAASARTDTRAWVVARRTRTKHLIELGGLVQKAGLVTITDDDRAMLYGAFLDLAQRLSGDDAEQAKLLQIGRAHV